jgi:hypothetical protein
MTFWDVQGPPLVAFWDWTVDGTGADIMFDLGFHGAWEFQGRGSQDYRGISLRDELSQVPEMTWSIKGGSLTRDAILRRSVAAPRHLPGPATVGDEFWTQYQENTKRSLAAIYYLPAGGHGYGHLLRAAILLGSDVAPLVYDTCKVLMNNRTMKYRLLFDVDVAAFRVKEFAHPFLFERRPFITDGIRLTIRNADTATAVGSGG